MLTVARMGVAPTTMRCPLKTLVASRAISSQAKPKTQITPSRPDRQPIHPCQRVGRVPDPSRKKTATRSGGLMAKTISGFAYALILGMRRRSRPTRVKIVGSERPLVPQVCDG